MSTDRPLPDHPLARAAVAEIAASHDFFVRWFLGTATRDEFELWLTTTHPDFRLTTPGGEMLDRGAIVPWIEGAFGSMADRFEVTLMSQGEAEEKKLALGTPEQKAAAMAALEDNALATS